MRARPDDLEERDLRHAVASGWGIVAESLSYVPEGGGSHHWKVVGRDGRPVFATVDDIDQKDWLGDGREARFAGLTQALASAHALCHEVGLGFVLAPFPSVVGAVARRMGSRYAVSVYPFLSGTSYPFGVHVDAGRRREVLEMMIAIHASTPVLPALPPDHRPTFGGRRDLDAALADPGRPWDGGPYSQRAHALVASQVAGLRAVVDAFDRLVDRTAAARSRSVVTHGEPHAGNVMWAGGNVWLIDWDTVGLGPPERDLWWLVEDADEAARYAAATGQAVNPEVMTLYRLRWYLDDIAQAVRLFAGQHLRTADTQRWWEGFPPRIGALDSWRERLGA